MADITMCNGMNCKKKNQCNRYKAKPSYWQSYMHYDNKNDDCQLFWEVK